MPWTAVNGGYRTKRGGFVRNPKQYEALRRKGMPKDKAAAIVNKRRREASGAAIASAGAVTGAVGLAAGGVPGTRPNGNAVFRMKPATGQGLKRVASGVKGKAVAADAVHGGILGFRGSIHELGTKHFEAIDAKNQAKRRGNEAKGQSFYRGYNAGKIAPEKSIIRGMKTGRKVAHGVLGAGTAATAYGVYRAKHNVKKSDNTQKYNGALLGAGTAGAAVAHGGSKYLGAQQKKYARRASANVDRAGELVPAIAGRHGQQMTLPQMSRYKRKNPGAPFPKTMHPVVRDGDIKRNPKLLAGVPRDTAETVGHLRGAAAQERHFAEVFGNTGKVVRGFRTPSALVAAAGAGGLAAAHRKKIAKGMPRDKALCGSCGRVRAVRKDGELQRHLQNPVQGSESGICRGRKATPVEVEAHKKYWSQFSKALPRYAMTKTMGRVRVLHQHSKDHFMCLDSQDTKRLIHRKHLTFVKNPRTPPPSGIQKYASTPQIRRRKKIAADLGITSAAIGLTTLGARGAQGALKATGKVRAVRAAEHIGRHTQTALIVGTGIGSVGALNSAAINRAESKPVPRKQHVYAKAMTAPVLRMGGSNNQPKQPGLPSVKSTFKTTVGYINTGKAPDIAPGAPGQKAVGKLQRLTGVNKGFVQGFKEGARAASHARPSPGRLSIRTGPKATHIAGKKTGAATHDFGQGFSRKVHTKAEFESGKVTTHANATYPGAYNTGVQVRRYGVPAVVLGGSYVGGKKIAERRHKVQKSDGVLLPISKAYGYDPEARRHRRAGVASGTALAVGAGAAVGSVHQGVQAARSKGGAINRGRTGKLTSVRVTRGQMVHGGRSAGLAAGAGAALAVGHHIKRKQTQGSWGSYY
jgi:hypothetical protein